MIHHPPNSGFTIFFATLVTSLALAIGLAIFDITVRELNLSGTANQSQYAIYAADTGAECAIYWDTHCSVTGCTDGSAFSTSTASSIPAPTAGQELYCNGIDIILGTNGNPVTPWTLDRTASAATTTIMLYFPPQPYCALVTIAKKGTPVTTVVTSHGYNTCQSTQTRVERALQVTY